MEWVAGTLKNLWISYNEIDKLDPLRCMQKLEVLYIGNNMIAKIDELNNLVNLFILLIDNSFLLYFIIFY